MLGEEVGEVGGQICTGVCCVFDTVLDDVNDFFVIGRVEAARKIVQAAVSSGDAEMVTLAGGGVRGVVTPPSAGGRGAEGVVGVPYGEVRC